MIINLKEILYLEWIFNRLEYRFKDDPKNIDTAKKIINKIKNPNLNIEDNNLDKIISKYYVDFYLDKQDNIGFSKNERDELRLMIKNLVKDVIYQRIPEQHTIIN